MRRVSLASILVFAALAATSAVAQQSAPKPDMMKPDPKLRQLDYFTGTWGCKGTASRPTTTCAATRASTSSPR